MGGKTHTHKGSKTTSRIGQQFCMNAHLGIFNMAIISRTTKNISAESDNIKKTKTQSDVSFRDFFNSGLGSLLALFCA